MTTTTLVVLYFCVGAALAVQTRSFREAVVMLLLWPLWAPFVLMPEKE